MNRTQYFKRINYTGTIATDYNTLAALHRHHVFHVPFENLDIHYKKPFDLEPENVYKKIVLNSRGGFCYELNSLFHSLLHDLGFKTKIISARIIDDAGTLGPEYDHMVICVTIDDQQFLADVGYGDLFLQPLAISEGVQHEGRNYFKIEKTAPDAFMLLMSSDEVNFQKKYVFSSTEVPLDHFHAICRDKQTNPSSYFVKNVVCTMPTEAGRVTVFNDKLTERKGDERTEKPIQSNEELKVVLNTKFAIIASNQKH